MAAPEVVTRAAGHSPKQVRAMNHSILAPHTNGVFA